MIAIIDYGLGNLASVRNAVLAAGGEVTVTSDPDCIRQASGVILPGVGAASEGMKRLRERALVDVVYNVAQSGVPFLGICLGMQLLFERSEEGDAECLGVIPGTVRLLRGGEKVPQIGWNAVAVLRNDDNLWRGLPHEPYFYFVHSYVCDPRDANVTIGVTEYGDTFCSAVARDSVWGTQFHPERSGRIGIQMIRNFVEISAASGATSDRKISYGVPSTL